MYVIVLHNALFQNKLEVSMRQKLQVKAAHSVQIISVLNNASHIVDAPWMFTEITNSWVMLTKLFYADDLIWS